MAPFEAGTTVIGLLLQRKDAHYIGRTRIICAACVMALVRAWIVSVREAGDP